jgi:nucleoside-diphosphate-sugar epimerase
MNPVLLTGATGFIGQRLQKTLLTDGKEVSAVVRPSSAHKYRQSPGVNQFLADLPDSRALVPAVSQTSAVIYCAGSVRGRTLEDFRAANIDGVRSIVDAMNQAGTESPLLLISSLAASRPHLSDYARSKYLGEQELIKYAGFPWTIFRPPAVYGPGDKEMLPILTLARKGLVTPTGPAGQKLSLIHVDDLASAALAWLTSWKHCREQIFTLDDGHSGGYDWRQIAEAASAGSYRLLNIPGWLLFGVANINLQLSRLFGYAPMLTPGKARELTQHDWVCNNNDLSEATEWIPAISLEKGIHMLFESTGKSQGEENGGTH